MPFQFQMGNSWNHQIQAIRIAVFWVQATNGEGVDVVLNSLSGRAIPASLNLNLSWTIVFSLVSSV